MATASRSRFEPWPPPGAVISSCPGSASATRLFGNDLDSGEHWHPGLLRSMSEPGLTGASVEAGRCALSMTDICQNQPGAKPRIGPKRNPGSWRLQMTVAFPTSSPELAYKRWPRWQTHSAPAKAGQRYSQTKGTL